MAVQNQTAENVMQVQMDVFDTPLAIPVGKLDADQYMADDLDGVTESLFGSGSMGYASLQASQADAALAASEPLDLTLGDGFAGSDTGGVIAGAAVSFGNTGNLGTQGRQDATDTDRALDEGGETGGVTQTGSENNIASTGSGGVFRQNASSSRGAAEAESFSGTDGSSGTSGDSGRSKDGNSGRDGTDGNDGDGGDECCGLINIDLGDLTTLIDHTFIDLGDVITNMNTLIEQGGDTLTQIIETINLGDIIDLDNIFQTVNNITVELNETVNNTLTQVTNITNNVTNILDTILNGEGTTLVLDIDLVKSALGHIEIPLDNPLATLVEVHIDTAPTMQLVNDLADMTGLEVLGDAVSSLGGVVEVLQDNINQVTDIVSDLDLTDVGETVGDIVELLSNLDSVVADITQAADDAVGEILGGLGLGVEEPDLAALGDIADNVLDLIGVSELGLNGETVLSGEDILGLVEDVLPVEDILPDLGDLDIVDEILSPLEGVLGDTPLADIGDDLGGFVGDALAGLGGGEIGGGDLLPDLGLEEILPTDGITDVLGGNALSVLDGVIDPVEGILGGGDLFADENPVADIVEDVSNIFEDIIPDAAGGDLLGGVLSPEAGELNIADGILAPVEDILGGEGLLGEADAGLLEQVIETVEDTVEGITENLADISLEDAFDPVEDIIGDMDLNIGDAIDLLGGDMPLGGQTDIVDDLIGSWTDSTISDVGGLFDDVINGSGGGGDILPEPIGSIAEGIGVLDVAPKISLGGLKGLFG